MRMYDVVYTDSGLECLAVPREQLEVLIELRDEYSAHLDSEHKNLHGYDNRDYQSLKDIAEQAWTRECLEEEVGLHGNLDKQNDLYQANLRLMILLVDYFSPFKL